MRIIHVTNNANTATLGVEREVATLAVAQQSSGSDVMIVTDFPGVFTESCREHGVSVVAQSHLKYPLGRQVPPEQDVELEEGVQAFIECVQDFNPDIIHCHSPGAALVAITAGNRVGVPCAFTSDGVRTSITGWQKGLRFAVLNLSQASFEELQKSEIPDENLYYVPNGTRSPQPEPTGENVGSLSPGLIFAGELESRKGIDVLILAMVELRRRLGQACPFLNIYGDGERGKYLTEMVSVLQLDDIVQFHGFKHGVLEECPSSDIFVLPSRNEASPLVVLEAMSRGMPIVATDVGEVARILPDSRYGRVVPKDCVILLADEIEALLADITDGRFDRDLPIERHRSFYSIEKFAERTEAAYSQILLNSSAVAL